MKGPLEHLSKERREGLDNLLRENPFLIELFQSNVDASTSRALGILSLAHRFDFDLYKNVLLERDKDLPPFEQLLKNPDVEKVPRRENQYWIRASGQSRWLAEGEEKPDARASWAKALATWLRGHHRDPAEVLSLYLSSDLPEALAYLQQEYQKADEANDLPLCHSFVEQVQANLERIPPADQGPFLDIAARYRARILFLQDFHRSVRYFPRPDVEEAFKEVVAAKDGKWILQLHARGGMGKTMFIQRVIAHHLLKEAPYPLIARLDLDFLSVSSIAAAPWLISIEIAGQLDEQLPGPLFAGSRGFQPAIENFRDLLYNSRSEQRSKRSDTELLQLRQKARDVSYWPHFVSRCLELPRHRPLVVFLDTLEEASLQSPAELRKLLERFEELQKSIPQLRLVLSGRFELGREHLVGLYDDKLREKERLVSLSPIRGVAAEEFVRQLAAGAPANSIVAIARMSEGNPFKMSMLCELIRVDPELKLDNLKKEEIDLAYLIKRVVERIPADLELGLRWLLRYGAIPRKLTFSFVRDILQPLLIRALKGEVEADHDDIPRPEDRLVWLQDEEAALAPETLWEQLSKYSGEHGWITLDSHDSQAAVFHSDVRGPMRRLLRDQPIYAQLNRAAAEHFAARAAAEAERWLEFKVVELYHRMQLAEGDLVKITQQAFEERPEPRDAVLRLELAREILKPEGDFCDVNDGVKAWASYEEADALAILGGFRYFAFGERRIEIRNSLKSACELAEKARLKLPSFVFSWREFLESASPRWRVAVLEYFFARDGEDRARYWLLLLDLFGQGLVPRFVIYVLSFLLPLRTRLSGSARIPSWVLRERYAASLMRIGNHQRAQSVLSEVTGKVVDKSDLDRVRRRLIDSQIESLDLQKAENEIALYQSDQDNQSERVLFQTEVHLLRRDAWSALKCCDELPKNFRYHLARARALGQLLRVNDALNSFASAREACPDPVLLDQIVLAEMQFRLFEGEMETQPLTRTRLDQVASSRWRIELELLRAHQSRNDPNVATGILSQLAMDPFSPAIQARAILAGIFWKLFPTDQLVKLEKILRGIAPVGARLYLLRPPVLVGEPIDISWLTSSNLRSSFHVTSWADSGLEETHWLLYAGLLRIVKQEEKKKKALSRIKLINPTSLPELARYRQRKRLEMESGPDPMELWSGLAAEPGLHAAALIENAERARLAQDRSGAERSLDAAYEVIEENNLDPLFESRWQAVAERLEGYRGATEPTLQSTTPLPSGETVRDALPGTSSGDQSKPTCFSFSCSSARLYVEEIGNQRAERRLSTTENEALHILTTSLRERSPNRLTPLLLERLIEVVEDLREPFRDSPNSPLDSDARQQVFLALKDNSLIAAPWEFALPHNVSLVRIREYTGQSFAEELNRPGPGHHQLTRPGPKPPESARRMGVLLLLKIPTRTVQWTSESDIKLTVDLYESRGAVCHTGYIEGGKVPSFEDGSSVRVVHLIGDFLDNPHLREPQFGGLTAESLSRILHVVGGRESRPLVILDVPMPRSISPVPFSEAAEQLYARNQFAQLLANTGQVSAVLAGGLGMGDEILVESTLEAERLTDIPIMIRQRCFESFNDAAAMYSESGVLRSWGPLGAALFMGDKRMMGHTRG